ncbi:HSP20 family protein [Thermodesulfovibrio aggregans]|uniref:HSP20 family protein n=1 Tax=Thermodesulfovibrio aggregans TaxID=86166 RepID=A0A0U9HTK5_9BACT|nr:Hsp20/alpha crystallin family protein [Thermodesulfovibrio aggregans]GAQ95769.1 HSP20 family protein [Thermodesulfovibrio aggregans]
MTRKETKDVARVEPSILSPFEEIERLFDEVMRRPFSLFRSFVPRVREEAEFISPAVDIYEEGDDLVVKAELPGINKEDIEVKITDDYITISGEKKREEKVEKKDYYRYERSYGSFSRTFRLPVDVQTDKAKAKFENGVLEIRIPKTEEAKKKERKLQIE